MSQGAAASTCAVLPRSHPLGGPLPTSSSVAAPPLRLVDCDPVQLRWRIDGDAMIAQIRDDHFRRETVDARARDRAPEACAWVMQERAARTESIPRSPPACPLPLFDNFIRVPSYLLRGAVNGGRFNLCSLWQLRILLDLEQCGRGAPASDGIAATRGMP